MREQEDSHHLAPIRTRAVVRLDACTIRGGKERAVPWRNPDPPMPGARSEKRDPTRHTKGIPTCQAWKLHPRCKCATSRCCDLVCAVREALAGLDRRQANPVACSDRTAWTIEVQQRPAAGRCVRLPTKRAALPWRRTRQLLSGVERRCDQIRC